jgi:hypothetical protein
MVQTVHCIASSRVIFPFLILFPGLLIAPEQKNAYRTTDSVNRQSIAVFIRANIVTAELQPSASDVISAYRNNKSDF